MRTLISLILILHFIPHVAHSQSVGVVEVRGSLKVGDSESDTPSPGTIKWSGTDFLGWDGSNWLSLTKSAAFDEVTLPLADDVQIDDFIYPIYFDESTYKWTKSLSPEFTTTNTVINPGLNQFSFQKPGKASLSPTSKVLAPENTSPDFYGMYHIGIDPVTYTVTYTPSPPLGNTPEVTDLFTVPGTSDKILYVGNSGNSFSTSFIQTRIVTVNGTSLSYSPVQDLQDNSTEDIATNPRCTMVDGTTAVFAYNQDSRLLIHPATYDQSANMGSGGLILGVPYDAGINPDLQGSVDVYAINSIHVIYYNKQFSSLNAVEILGGGASIAAPGPPFIIENATFHEFLKIGDNKGLLINDDGVNCYARVLTIVGTSITSGPRFTLSRPSSSSISYPDIEWINEGTKAFVVFQNADNKYFNVLNISGDIVSEEGAPDLLVSGSNLWSAVYKIDETHMSTALTNSVSGARNVLTSFSAGSSPITDLAFIAKQSGAAGESIKARAFSSPIKQVEGNFTVEPLPTLITQKLSSINITPTLKLIYNQ